MKHYLDQYISQLENSKIVLQAKATNRGNLWILEIVKYIIVCFVSEYLAGWMIAFLNSHHVPLFDSIGQPQILFGIGLQSVGAIMFCYLYENMKLKNIGIVRKGVWSHLAQGYLIGMILICIVIFILWAIRSISLSNNFQNINPSAILILLMVYFFQAFGEEVMYRGYCLMSLARKNNIVVAIFLSSMLFSLHHYQSPGYGIISFINLFLLAVFFSVLVLRKNDIWISTGIHSAWNFVQGNIFGVQVSGAEQSSSCTLFVSHPNGESVLHGGAMGLEASLITTVVLITSIVVLMWKDILKFNRDDLQKHK